MFSDCLFLMTMLTVNSVHEDLANLTSRFDEVRPQWYSCFCGWSSMVKFSGRKTKEMTFFFLKKSLNGKSDKLKNLGLRPAKLFISDLMCHENHQLFYRCRQLKRWDLSHSAWFFSNCIYYCLCKSWRELRCYKN